MSPPASTVRPSRAERQARRCLAAFPWRDREERGEEIIGTVLDSLPPGAERLPRATAVDLVRGGLRTRRQRRPPWTVRVAYRMGMRIHPRWLRWVRDDLDHPRYARVTRLRVLAVSLPALVLLWMPFAVVFGWSVWLQSLAILLGPSALRPLLLAERERREARERHGLVPGGRDPQRVWVWYWIPSVTPNVPIAPLAAGLGGGLTLGATACLWAVSHQRPGVGVGVAPAPPDVLWRLVPFVGVGAGLGLIGTGLVAVAVARARYARAGSVAPLSGGRGALVAGALLGAMSGFIGVALARELFIGWASWESARVPAAVLPVGLGLLAFAARARRTRRRRGTPLGVWEVLPVLGERWDIRLVTVDLAAHFPVEHRWMPADRVPPPHAA